MFKRLGIGKLTNEQKQKQKNLENISREQKKGAKATARLTANKIFERPGANNTIIGANRQHFSRFANTVTKFIEKERKTLASGQRTVKDLLERAEIAHIRMGRAVKDMQTTLERNFKAAQNDPNLGQKNKIAAIEKSLKSARFANINGNKVHNPVVEWDRIRKEFTAAVKDKTKSNQYVANLIAAGDVSGAMKEAMNGTNKLNASLTKLSKMAGNTSKLVIKKAENVELLNIPEAAGAAEAAEAVKKGLNKVVTAVANNNVEMSTKNVAKRMAAAKGATASSTNNNYKTAMNAIFNKTAKVQETAETTGKMPSIAALESAITGLRNLQSSNNWKKMVEKIDGANRQRTINNTLADQIALMEEGMAEMSTNNKKPNSGSLFSNSNSSSNLGNLNGNNNNNNSGRAGNGKNNGKAKANQMMAAALKTPLPKNNNFNNNMSPAVNSAVNNAVQSQMNKAGEGLFGNNARANRAANAAKIAAGAAGAALTAEANGESKEKIEKAAKAGGEAGNNASTVEKAAVAGINSVTQNPLFQSGPSRVGTINPIANKPGNGTASETGTNASGNNGSGNETGGS